MTSDNTRSNEVASTYSLGTITPDLKPCQKCQNEFEKWYSGDNPDCPSIRRNGNGYPLIQTQISWTAWESAWNTRAEVPQPVTDAVNEPRVSDIERQQALEFVRFRLKWGDINEEFVRQYTNIERALTAGQTSLSSSETTITQPVEQDHIKIYPDHPLLKTLLLGTNPVDVEALKEEYTCTAKEDQELYWKTVGYNAAIDHIASEYHLTKKSSVKTQETESRRTDVLDEEQQRCDGVK